MPPYKRSVRSGDSRKKKEKFIKNFKRKFVKEEFSCARVFSCLEGKNVGVLMCERRCRRVTL